MVKSITRSILAYLLVAIFFSGIAHAADHPTIMVTIKPFYNICARVMQSVGKPELLLHNNASPHDYQLKPSDVKLIENADLIIWGGPELEAYLQKPLSNVTANKALNLAKISGLKLLPLRTSTNWETHDHEHGDHSHCNHGGFNDAHFWLNPDNAIVIAQSIAKQLSKIDPVNAKIYSKNAKEFASEIYAKDKKWQQRLKPMHDVPFIVFHDAYQYFDNYFKLDGVGSITLNPEIPPSVQRIQQIQALLKQKHASCIFSEPQFNSKIIATVTEGLKVYHGTLDPLGTEADIGPNGYFVLMDNLVNGMVSCAKHAE